MSDIISDWPVDDPPGKDGTQGPGANQNADVPEYEPGTNPVGTNPPVPTPDTATTYVPGTVPGVFVDTSGAPAPEDPLA